MFRAVFYPFLLLLRLAPALARLESGQRCDPSKESNCPPDPAFGGTATFDFATAHWDGNLHQFWTVGSSALKNKQQLDFDTGGSGVGMGILGPGDTPTFTSNRYLFFGEVSVIAKAAPGPGLVTTIALVSDDGNEIVWELLGIEPGKVQTNYFYSFDLKVNTYNRTYALDSSSTTTEFHKYTIRYSASSLAFSIDDKLRETRYPGGDIPKGMWPQTPMQVKIGLWSTVDTSEQGEKAWAGGVPSFSTAPFWAYFKSVQVKDEMGGCVSASGPVEYTYSTPFAGWESVQVKGCVLPKASGITLHTSSTEMGVTPTPLPPTATTAAEGDMTASSSSATSSSTTQLDAPPKESDESKANAADRVSVFLSIVVGGLWVCYWFSGTPTWS